MQQQHPRPRRCRNKNSLPFSRGHISNYLMLSLPFVGAILQFVRSTSEEPYKFLIEVGVLILLYFITELLVRLLYSVEEMKHFSTKYDRDFLMFVKDTFYFSNFVWFTAIGLLFLIGVQWWRSGLDRVNIWDQSFPCSITSFVVVEFLRRTILKMDCGPCYDSRWIENSNGLNYGAGMAHSFFHGYIRYILPKTGNSEKNLMELMQDYESRNAIKFCCYKLFVLIPKSLFCPPSLMSQTSPTIEESRSLQEKQLTVAGVQNRVYKNAVYKIKLNSHYNYVVAEYATPIKTFRDVVNYDGIHSKYYKKYRNDILLQFYLTLRELIKEDPDCKDFCELIYFDDKRDKNYLDVGKVLMASIKKNDRRSARS